MHSIPNRRLIVSLLYRNWRDLGVVCVHISFDIIYIHSQILGLGKRLICNLYLFLRRRALVRTTII